MNIIKPILNTLDDLFNIAGAVLEILVILVCWFLMLLIVAIPVYLVHLAIQALGDL